MIRTITATQVYKAISPVIRKNITDLYVFKLRNQADLDGVIEVVSMISKKDESEIRDMITSGKVTLTAKIIKDIFKEIGLEGKWCYNSSSIGCKASKEEMQKGRRV